MLSGEIGRGRAEVAQYLDRVEADISGALEDFGDLLDYGWEEFFTPDYSGAIERFTGLGLCDIGSAALSDPLKRFLGEGDVYSVVAQVYSRNLLSIPRRLRNPFKHVWLRVRTNEGWQFIDTVPRQVHLETSGILFCPIISEAGFYGYTSSPTSSDEFCDLINRRPELVAPEVMRSNPGEIRRLYQQIVASAS